ncbi:hypothetical protein EXIGLDRAFT_776021 [Exidia glandulosa HHB12029]|uniref:Uncharacterized protein n=1 Tax=Exidia glandulosa HHB12029 TaxID=1314781 RepID=A0A165DND3_EXIGL|nr:hypothetical protein EXIGLDRAFT_776021 [Exidia glandulosa HHB12029]
MSLHVRVHPFHVIRLSWCAVTVGVIIPRQLTSGALDGRQITVSIIDIRRQRISDCHSAAQRDSESVTGEVSTTSIAKLHLVRYWTIASVDIG